MRLARRNERSHLRHKNDERRLPQQSRLTRHVGAGNHHDLLLLVVEPDIVGNIFLAYGHQRLDHRMAALLDVDQRPVVQLGADVAAFAGNAGERLKTVDTRYNMCIAQQLR